MQKEEDKDGIEQTQGPPPDLGGKTRSRQGSVTFQDPEIVPPTEMESFANVAVRDRVEVKKEMEALEEALKIASANGE